jgi:transcription-repair coupling factor (superfamily II helicase)
MSEVSTAEQSGPPLGGLVDRLQTDEDFTEWFDRIVPGSLATTGGVWGSACALLAAALAARCSGPLVVVCEGTDRMDDLADEWPLFGGGSCDRFPAWETDPGERVVYDEVFGQRLRVLKTLATANASEPSEPPRVIATSIQSLLQGVPAPSRLTAATRQLRVGETVDIKALTVWLIEAGMHRTSSVELPGEFAIRGGLVDIFAADLLHPLRLEMFGEQIESIRQFSVSSQRSLREETAVEITTLSVEESARTSLMDYLPAASLLLLVEPAQLGERAGEYLERTEAPEKHFSYRQLLKRASPFRTVCAEAVATAAADQTLALPFQSVERFTGDIQRVREELDRLAGDQIVDIVCSTEAESERVGEILSESQIARAGKLHLLLGCLHAGFCLPQTGRIVISSGELFHRQEIRRTARRRLGRAIDSFTDLRRGDLVVHLAHGIGRYLGLDLITRENQTEEHLKLEFAGGTKIYVPASRITLVQKYVGGSGHRPRLARIGGQRWLRQKKAAESAVTDMAVEMLSVQAARRTRLGICFPEDSHWQQEFDASFPYRETPDQLASLQAIKTDMCHLRPMDRLLCGDVGFGKTEIAIRAAFKAVDSGYQVGVLVPTTILAAQHLKTFQNRMAEYPIEIASLSRFSTRSEQSATVKRLAEGKIDIVIGTHRLAQQDVQFENLGLVIIDEEQRFGVEIKERLKAVRQTVDVLTMTATPIPRTLHLSLLGARDISNLETPPEDRMAVETRVARFDPELIRHAILRELNRNGQIFFVHNRVQDIDRVAARLREIVPEATIETGHGQMPEGKLEQVMADFVSKRFDILLATTIVENGLDIPNANTIFIDEADRYGLADLHQLRGRVGRYKHRAYCYLLIDEKKHLSPASAKRLRAIEEFSEMGAGFQIAMRDLEIRGAGNILGTQQSGHISAVGYELYCQLLDQAVRKLRKQPPQELCDVDIDLPGEAQLPDSYIPDLKSKIDLYRRLARITTSSDAQQIREEMIDRFGAPPPMAARLLDLAVLRIDATIWAIHSIGVEQGLLVLGYGDASRIERLKQIAELPVRIADASSAYVPLVRHAKDPDRILETVKSLLRAR